MGQDHFKIHMARTKTPYSIQNLTVIKRERRLGSTMSQKLLSSCSRALLCWCDPLYKAQWKDIECSVITDIPIQAILADNKRLESTNSLENPWVKSTLNVWKELIKTYKLEKTVKILGWCAYDSNFAPNGIDSRFTFWITKGITHFFQIVQDNQIKSFQILKDNFKLEKQDFYRDLQLRNYYNHEIKQSNIDEYNPLIQLFIKAYKSELTRGLISQLYKSICNLNSFSTKYIRDKWEKEGVLVITDEEWEQICISQWRSTKSHTWKEYCWENMSCYFIPPT